MTVWNVGLMGYVWNVLKDHILCISNTGSWTGIEHVEKHQKFAVVVEIMLSETGFRHIKKGLNRESKKCFV